MGPDKLAAGLSIVRAAIAGEEGVVVLTEAVRGMVETVAAGAGEESADTE